MKNFRLMFFLFVGFIIVFQQEAYSEPISFTGNITSDVTLNVPADFSTINDAISYLNDKRIKTGVSLTIQVADGSYQYDETITVNHVDGDKISILGNISDPSLCTLYFNGVSGLTVSYGNKLRLFDGFKIVGNQTPYTNGIQIEYQSFLTTGDAIVVQSFGNIGILASHNSTIVAGTIESSNNGSFGFYSVYNSLIKARDSIATGNSDYNYAVNVSGTIDADGSSSSNSHFGYHASNNGYISARDTISSNNSQDYSPIKDTLGNRNSFVCVDQ
ncbi:MAG: hypothetical protein MI799_08055 [Desulfobacterales bacterium]|nr:hypothetical protein [Desulfobacterales bacterium]